MPDSSMLSTLPRRRSHSYNQGAKQDPTLERCVELSRLPHPKPQTIIKNLKLKPGGRPPGPRHDLQGPWRALLRVDGFVDRLWSSEFRL